MKALNLRLITIALLLGLVLLGGGIALVQRDSLTVDELPTLAPTLEVAVAQAVNMETSTVTPIETDSPPTETATASMTPTIALTNTPTAGATSTSSPTLAPTRNIPTLPPSAVEVSVPTTEPIVVAPPSEPVPDVVIVRVDPSQLEQLQADVASQGGTVELVDEALGAVTIQLPNADALEEVTQAEYVEASEPDYFVSVQQSEADPLTDQQWSLSAMNIPTTVSADARAIKVAVIDSGVCDTHPELSQKIIGGYDYVQSDSTPQDEMGHGCAVAGIIASAVNGVGMVGVAPNAQLLIYRVLNANGSGRYSHVASAIVRAVDDGAQIINLSLGGANASQLLQDAVTYALERNVLVVAAAGNNGSGSVLYPALYEGVISVGASGRDLNPATFSNYGKIDLWAPGVEVLSLTLQGEYASFNGTSFAAPNVSGLLARNMGVGVPVTVRGGGFARYADEIVVVEPTQSSVVSTPTEDFTLPDEQVIATVAYNRNAAVAWANQNNMKDSQFRGQSNGRWCTTYVAGALNAGGLNIPSNLYGNQQIISWMLNNPNSWEFRPPNDLIAGDFIFYSNQADAPSNWAYIDPGYSKWDHVALVTSPGRVSAWNAEVWEVPNNYFSGLPYRLGVHIKDEAPPPSPGQQHQGTLSYGVTPAVRNLNVQHRWLLPVQSGHAPVLFDIQRRSGSGSYSVILTDAWANRLVETRGSVNGRGIVSYTPSTNGDLYLHIIPDNGANLDYSVTAWANSIPRIFSQWTQDAYHDRNTYRWQIYLDTSQDFYVNFERYAGDLEFQWRLQRRDNGTVLSTGSSVNGRVQAPGNAAGWVDFYITSSTGSGSYLIHLRSGKPKPGIPSILTPSMGSTVSGSSVTVKIQPGPGSGQGTPDWQVQVDDNSDFSSPVFDNYLTGWSRSTEISIPLPTKSGDYFIRVRQGDGTQNGASDFTPAIRFTYISVEREALIDLYNSTNGSGWTNKSGWLTTSDHCTWYGVSCDNNGKVTNLDLWSNQLSGTIPSSLGNLTNLERLHLYSNQLSGSIPSSLGNNTNLKELHFYYNQLSGNIPSSLSNLTGLEYLTLHHNQLVGNIPEIRAHNLKVLDISYNQLSGGIPSSLNNLINLESLNLGNNQLSGGIPVEIGNLTKLQWLYLSNNQLSGNIPSSLNNLINLEWLSLGNNHLSGSIPVEIGNLTKLQGLYLYRNQLSGGIPVEMGNLTELKYLDLFNNQLSGSIPLSLGNLTNLYALYLHNNQLSGSAPNLTNLSSLNYLRLCVSGNEGVLPSGNPTNDSFIARLDSTFSVTTGCGVSSPTPIPTPPPPARNGTVSGTVYHQDGTSPISNVRVHASGAGWQASTCTNSNGQYTITGVPQQNFITVVAGLETSSPNQCANSIGLIPEYWQESRFRYGTPITFTSNNQTRSDINFTLEYSANAGSSLPAPQLVSPTNGTNLSQNTILYSWYATTGATSYTLTISGTQTVVNAEDACDVGSFKLCGYQVSNVPNGSYTWSVKANRATGSGASSPSATFTVSGVVLVPTPNPTSPINGAGITTFTPSLVWSAVTGATGYEVRYGLSNPPTQVISNLTGTSYTFTQPLTIGTFYWQARAKDSINNWSAWSSVASFKLNNVLDGTVTGTVYHQDGTSPISNVRVHASGAGWQASTCTNSNGQYTITGVPQQNFITVVAGLETSSPNQCANSIGLIPEYWQESRFRYGTPITFTSNNQTRSDINFTLEYSANAGSSLPAPQLVSPTNGTNLSQNTFLYSWYAVTGATSYTLTISGTQTVVNAEDACDVGSFKLCGYQVSNVPNGSYTWSVKANRVTGSGASSPSATFTVSGIVLVPTPNPTSPINGAGITTFTPALAWSAVTGATGYEVRYGLSNPPTQVISNLASTSYTFSRALTTGTFYWQVRAKDRTNSWSAWSSVVSFNVNSVANSAPRLGRQSAETISLTWNPQSWAQGYQVQVSTNTGFTALVYQSATLPSGENSDSPTLGTGTYYWRVRGLVSGTTWGAWSTTETLVVR